MFDDLFYKRLSQLRMQKGVSARDMSLSIGQSSGYINRVENKKMLPSMTAFFYICEYFGITPKEFFDIDTSNPAIIEEIITDLKSLDDEQLKNISALIKGLRK